MTSTQLINDVSAALREHIYLLDELNIPVVASWDTIDRLTPGILDSPAFRAQFQPNTSMKNEEEIKFYVHCV
ncbi:unnamed protein product [Bursaphelenchus xylophilus]|uniref:(pine wood nematode) hypothetical protein n=1 Tax=Bursaphelenchus xylophilus TaxID=6326 RepID=A0A1I7S1H7_BURXY|nr:unnamed protein product [Bursaphelenchus xylophilus]CAG9081476.1 unnamed protein product [Bursaphelenchus xylophilus]